MSEKKVYVVGCNTPEGWEHVHQILMQDGTLEDNIPSRPVEVVDTKDHSPTRAVYLLTDEEAEQMRNHPDVRFVNLDLVTYRDQFRPPAEELHFTPRYSQAVKNYAVPNNMPSTPDSTDLNRAGYQLLRCSQYLNPWQSLGNPLQVIDSNIPKSNTGLHVDVVVSDEATWYGHVEFNYTGNGPTDYIQGNKLSGAGTCGLLDLVLDSPYYIDPAWFNADPVNRLTTRFDGTVVPTSAAALAWWQNSSNRSPQFAAFGNIAVPGWYTRESACGDYSTKPLSSANHGTACSGLTFGRTYGWAYNANKWTVDSIGFYGTDIEIYFDILKIFHQYKPINPIYGTKDPTIATNSWGYRATTPSTGFYYFRQGTTGAGGVSYSGTKPEFMRWIGYYGDANRCIGEMIDNSMTVAGEELVNSGVIFLAAAGNSNQKIVKNTNADFNNYWSTSENTPLTSAIHQEFGVNCYNTTSRRGFPQQIGKFNSGGTIIYPVLAIGALDARLNFNNGKEQKVDYSVMGESTDVYAPADDTLTCNNNYSPNYRRIDSYGSGVNFGQVSLSLAFSQLTGATLSLFKSFPNSGYRLTTIGSSIIEPPSASCTLISNSILGPAGLSGPFPTPTSGNNDNGYWTINLPFSILYVDVPVTTLYVGTNGYVIFKTSDNINPSTTNNCSGSEPALACCFSGSRAPSGYDFSCQRIYYGASGSAPNRTFRIRWEGTNATTGVVGSPNMVFELTFTENSGTFDVQVGTNGAVSQPIYYDTSFGGTSAACPVAAGIVATQLQTNRSWTYADVRNWLQSITLQSDTTFYQGPDPSTANSVDWGDVNSLMGGQRRVIYTTVQENTGTTSGSFIMSGGVSFRII